MANLMPCGHTDVWMFRARDKGMIHRYCLKCVFEKVGVPDAYAKRADEHKTEKLDEKLPVLEKKLEKKKTKNR